jgi:uncharacterized protein (DUF1501 family)
LGLALSPAFQRLLAAEGAARRARACILLWLGGGPSHIDTFDPKPGSDTNGPFKPIDTAIPGLQFCEYLPKLAGQAKHLAVVRSLTSKEQDHDRATEYLHTGNLRDETVEYPALGSVVAREWSAEDGDLPAFVAINESTLGGGFLGVQYSPYVITDLNAPLQNIALPEGVDAPRQDRRLKALDRFNQGFAARGDATAVAEFARFTARALRFQKSPALKAFDLKAEKPEVVAAYGAENDQAAFARGCLLARRLVEHGVRFVEVTLSGWDTHENNFSTVTGLCRQLDAPFAALLKDLADRGLLGQTLVVCLGEFGRTPKVNEQNGRDHWSDAFSAVLAGGGVRGGQIVGASDAKGEQVKERPVTVPDLYATLLSAFGVDGKKTYRTQGRPIRLADKGTVVKELF